MKGNELKEWRKKKHKLSLRELACFLHIAPSTLLRWESSDSPLNKEIIEKLDNISALLELDLLRVAYSNDIWSSLVLLALSPHTSAGKVQKTQKSFFEVEGFSVKTQEFPTGREAYLALLKGDVDIAPVSDRVLENIINQNQAVSFATILIPKEGIIAVSAKELELHNPLDLRNKKIGVLEGTISEHLLIELFSIFKITEFDEGLPYIETYPEADSVALAYELRTGRIDMFLGWQPHIARIIAKLEVAYKLPFMSFVSKVIFPVKYHLVVSQKLLKCSFKLKRLARSLLHADHFFKTQRNRALDIIAKSLKFDPDLISEQEWNGYQFKVDFESNILLNYLIDPEL